MKKRIRRFALVILLLLLLLNAPAIGRFFYPFPYRDIINHHAARYGLDPLLLAAIIKTESNFHPLATSPKGARGLMQIMPKTGAWVAEEVGIEHFHADILYDPETNICVGAWYLSDLFREFNGDIVLVLAAYNGGRGNVKKWLAEQKNKNSSSLPEQFPFPETRNYVKKVLYTYKIYKILYD